MVDLISASIITKGLALPANTTTGGTEAAITTAAHTRQVAKNIAANISEANKAEAAERGGFYKDKLKAPSRRNQNFPQAQQRDGSEAVDTDWEFRGAKSSNSKQVLRRPEQPSDAWSKIATSRERLSQIDRDFSNNGLQLNLAA